MNIFDEIVRRVRKEMRVENPEKLASIDANSTIEELGLSSLQTAEIVFGLEEDFGLSFDEERAASVRTLGDLVLLANESLGHELPESFFAARASAE